VHEYLDDEARITAGFAAAPGSTFQVAGPKLDRNRARVGAGVTAALSERLSLNAGYAGELAASDRSHNFAATLRWRF
jgi:outer membrane autotransporter protein